jgi:hypothetical protein
MESCISLTRNFAKRCLKTKRREQRGWVDNYRVFFFNLNYMSQLI